MRSILIVAVAALLFTNWVSFKEVTRLTEAIESNIPVIVRSSYRAGCYDAKGLSCDPKSEVFAAPLYKLMEDKATAVKVTP